MVILNPNCSEIVWRLNLPKSVRENILDALEDKERGTIETDTSSYPNNCIENMLELLEDYDGDVNDIDLEIVSNSGGGGRYDYVEECFETAMKVVRGEITKEEALKIDERDW